MLHVESIANSQKNLLNAFAQIRLPIIRSTKRDQSAQISAIIFSKNSNLPPLILSRKILPFAMSHANFDQALFCELFFMLIFAKKAIEFLVSFGPFCLVISIG